MVRDLDEELARMDTAVGDTPGPPPWDAPAGTSVGRYRLERKLGVGGMGVVYVAFDPDLERRVALKLLRNTGDDAAKRLQREARAMARLTHPNVVTVHEVGTAGGRDYVAMELVEGETLAEWLRARKPAPREVLEAFLAAGRGLAAAHDAGIVHRDFKPHNVLRSHKGRVAVTDFGLARESHVQRPSGTIGAVLPSVALSESGTSNTPSELAGLTASGSVLGTPAYMAPEQWSGGAVTPATDQFGYCVALWEAFTGQRPFIGPSLEQLRDQVNAGPQLLDASKLPRRLRSVLRRGLDPDPKQRFASMPELIAELGAPDRRIAYGLIAVGIVLTAVILIFTLRSGGGATTPACAAPVVDPKVAWSDATRMQIANGRQAAQIRALDADIGSWTATRAKACAAEPLKRASALTCLDGVLVRFAAVVRALHELGSSPYTDAGALLIDPTLCLRAPPPRLSLALSPALVDVIAATLREEADPNLATNEVFSALTRVVAKEPCASALAQLIGMDVRLGTAERDSVLAAAEQAAETCGDDRVRAEVALAIADSSLSSGYLLEANRTKVARAEAAVQRVAQPDLIARVELEHASIAARLGDLAEAVTRTQVAVAGFSARDRSVAQIKANLRGLAYRRLGASPADLDIGADQLARWRELGVARAGEDSEIVRAVDRALARIEMERGDSAAATARYAHARRPLRQDPEHTLTGRIVDETGAPVAGALVALARVLFGSSTSAAMHVDDDGSYRETVSAADGSFAIPGAPDTGVVIASLGGRRTIPHSIAKPVELVLLPTSRLEGTVRLQGVRSGNLDIQIKSSRQSRGVRYSLRATLFPDGRFEVDGVPRGKVDVFTSLRSKNVPSISQVMIEVRDRVHRGLVLDVPQLTREVIVLVRSTFGRPLQNAQVWVIAGTVASMSVQDFLALPTKARISGLGRQITKADETPAIAAVARPGDLFSQMGAPDGEATACALGLADDFGDPSLTRMMDENVGKLRAICVPIPASAIVTIEVPPFPRLD